MKTKRIDEKTTEVNITESEMSEEFKKNMKLRGMSILG